MMVSNSARSEIKWVLLHYSPQNGDRILEQFIDCLRNFTSSGLQNSKTRIKLNIQVTAKLQNRPRTKRPLSVSQVPVPQDVQCPFPKMSKSLSVVCFSTTLAGGFLMLCFISSRFSGWIFHPNIKRDVKGQFVSNRIFPINCGFIDL